MDEEINIEYPLQIDCLLDQQSQTYSCSLQLTNKGNHSLYFYISSTFGMYMRQTTGKRHIPASTSLTLYFTFKSTNIISHHHQFICLSISYSKLSQLYSLTESSKLKVGLRFTENFVNDPLIEEIVAEQTKHLIEQGEQKEILNQYHQAKIKYQEAFQLLRKCDKALFGMSSCHFNLNECEKSLRDIQTALIISPDNARYQFLKAKILLKISSSHKSNQGEIIEECLKIFKQIDSTKKSALSETQQNQLKNTIKKIEQNPVQNRMTMLKKKLIEKALSKYNQKLPLSKHFSSKTQLSICLKQILLSDGPQQNTTPEQIIDPISYQIMSNPLILSSGHSFQGKTLQLYFQKNGYKDPITRKDTYPQWIFNNNNLRDFIKDNPKLKIWKQYQYDLIHK